MKKVMLETDQNNPQVQEYLAAMKKGSITVEVSQSYINHLLELVYEIENYVRTTDCTDYTFLSKLSYLLGYINALDDKKAKTGNPFNRNK